MTRTAIKFTKPWRDKWYRFLLELEKHGQQSMAARDSGVVLRDMIAIRDENPERAAEYAESIEISTGALILEARRRGQEGVTKDVYYQGAVVGHQQEFSDGLLMFLIKGQDPRYATERRELCGPDGGDIPIPPPLGLSSLNKEDLKTLLEIAKKLRPEHFREG
jgi:hypothetical protein